jgi:hypothetical protein
MLPHQLPTCQVLNTCAQPSYTKLKPRQVAYFDRFQNHVIYQLGDCSLDGFWFRTVLRESTRDTCVLEMILGIGALAHALEIAPTHIPLFKTPVSGHLANRYYVDAIQYFTRSLANFRQRIEASELEGVGRTVLISTILFSTFENLQGNSESADELLYTGMKMLKEKMPHSASPNRKSQIAGLCDDEGVEDAEFILMRGLSFRSLLLPLNDQVRQDICAYKMQCTKGPKPPAQKEDFRTFWKLWMQFLTVGLRWYIKSQHPPEDFDPAMDSAALMREQQSLLAQAVAWEVATVQKLANEPDVYGRSNLTQIIPGVKTLQVFIQTALDDTEETNHRACQIAREIDHMIESIIGEVPRRIHTCLASLGRLGEIYEGVACAVLGLILICREADVRARGMQLLRNVVTSDSRWDSKEIVMRIFTLVAIEEEGRDENGVIPLAARYEGISSAWNKDYTELDVLYRAKAAKDGSPCGVLEERHMVLCPMDFGLL